MAGVAGAALAFGAAAAGPAAAGPTRRPVCRTAPARPTTLPPLSDATLRPIIAHLPDKEVSGAIVRISGTAGCWRGTGGIADLRTGRAVPADGRFRVGSITKMFTATVALQLVAEGALDLDRPVRDYLPDLLPASYQPVLRRHG